MDDLRIIQAEFIAEWLKFRASHELIFPGEDILFRHGKRRNALSHKGRFSAFDDPLLIECPDADPVTRDEATSSQVDRFPEVLDVVIRNVTGKGGQFTSDNGDFFVGQFTGRCNSFGIGNWTACFVSDWTRIR
jgi:hypothetical protein